MFGSGGEDYDLVVRNGKIFTHEKVFEGDICVKGDKIVKISRGAPAFPGGEEIDASGKLVFPGVVDVHVHLRDPGMEHKEDFFSGSCAAAAGGVTTVADMPNTFPPTNSSQRLNEKIDTAKRKSVVDFSLYLGLPSKPDELEELLRHACALKVYLAETTGAKLVPRKELLVFLGVVKKQGVPVAVHAEDQEEIDKATVRLCMECPSLCDPTLFAESRPNIAEEKAVGWVVNLANTTGCRFHICHISTGGGLELVRRHKMGRVTCEATPHHLLLTKEDLRDKGSIAKTNPPLRSKQDVDRLWSAVVDGTIFCLATDHAPHSLDEKDVDIWSAPAGVPNLDIFFPLMFTSFQRRGVPLTRLAKLLSYNPAKLFGLIGKGELAPGRDADIIIVDPNSTGKVDPTSFMSKAKYSPFEGWELGCKVTTTIVRGRTVFNQGEILCKPGYGKFLHPQRRNLGF